MKIIHFSAVTSDEDTGPIFTAVSHLMAGIETRYNNESMHLGIQPYDYEPDAEEPEVEKLTYDEDTMTKVYQAFYDSGISEDTATEIVSRLQNSGILFRERSQ